MGVLFQTSTSTPLPTQYWIGLSKTEPTVNGTNVSEPSTNNTGYGRILLTSLSTPVNGVVKNNNRIAFGLCLSAWGNMTHYVIYDKQTGGNLLKYGALTKAVNVIEDVLPIVDAEELVFTLKDEII